MWNRIRPIPLTFGVAAGSRPPSVELGSTRKTSAWRPKLRQRPTLFECAAIQDVLVVGKALNERETGERKVELDRMAAMLSRVGGRGDYIEEAPLIYGRSDVDTDSDFDTDFDRRQ